MGNCCSKKNKLPDSNRSHTKGLGNTDTMFMKSKLEKFKKGVYNPESTNNKKGDEENPLTPVNDDMSIQQSVSKTTSELDENHQGFSNSNRRNESAKSSEFTPRIKTEEYSDSKLFHDISGTMESQFSKSHSGSKVNDLFTLQDPEQYQKGKIISRGENKAIYQCMHKSTGKLLIAKTYFV